MVLFLRNKRFNFMLFCTDYYLRWWRLPIEERACRKTDLGGGDYYLRNSRLPPSAGSYFKKNFVENYRVSKIVKKLLKNLFKIAKCLVLKKYSPYLRKLYFSIRDRILF